MGEILVNSKEEMVQKAILKFSVSSTNRLWLKYINKIVRIDYLRNDIFDSIINKFSSWNLKFLTSMSNEGNIINMIKTLINLTNYACLVSFSPNGEILAYGIEGGTISLWDVNNEEEIGNLKGRAINENSVKFSPNGKVLAFCSNFRTISLWDIESRIIIRNLELSSIKMNYYNVNSFTVNCISFSPNGEILASGVSDGTISLLDVKNGKEINLLQGHSKSINCISYSPDGKTIATGDDNGSIYLWNAKSGKNIKNLASYYSPVRTISFSPDSRLLASCSGRSKDSLELWDTTSGKRIYTFGRNSG